MIAVNSLDDIVEIVNNANERVRELPNNPDGSFPEEKWLPSEIREILAQEYRKPDEEKTHLALVKYFNPYGSGTWWVSEYDDEYERFFGKAEIQFKELGYMSEQEMRQIKAPPFGLPLERDLWFEPKPLEDC